MKIQAALLALLASLLLAACGGGGDAPAPASQPAAQPTTPSLPTITGEVSAGDLQQLPEGVNLVLRLLDVSDPSQPPAEIARHVAQTRRLPHSYALPYPPERIDPERRYEVEAILSIEGMNLYGTPDPMPVLTQGAGRAAAPLMLVRGGARDTSIAPAEQFKRDFELLASQLGNLRRIVGERIENEVTVGWDAFVDGSGVRFVRERVDYTDGSSASFRYAFRYDRPWVLERERGGTTAWIGWDADGEAVLNDDGRSGRFDEGRLTELRARAEEVLRVARTRVR